MKLLDSLSVLSRNIFLIYMYIYIYIYIYETPVSNYTGNVLGDEAGSPVSTVPGLRLDDYKLFFPFLR
jgi:hypothetical protein